MPRTLAERERPLICLVTDRRRWLTGRAAESGRAVLDFVVSRVGVAARAGVDLVQIRERDLPARDLQALVAACVEIVQGTDTLIIVNERADVALATGAHGVHLRSASLAATRLRQLVPRPLLVGRSVHGVSEVLAGAGRDVDYLIAGAVFPTRSKPGSEGLLGPDGLAAIVAAAQVPVLAIGGVSVRQAPLIAATGVAGLAGIDLFVPALEAEDACGNLLQSLRAVFVA